MKKAGEGAMKVVKMRNEEAIIMNCRKRKLLMS